MAGLPVTDPKSLCIGLPEEIFGFEILVRLPAKDLARCRAVCRAWRRLASTRDVLLAHHRRQPSLPLAVLAKHDNTWSDLRTINHRATAGAAEVRLQPVTPINGAAAVSVDASCDGLLLLSVCAFSPPYIDRDFICNPTTRQVGQVPEIHGLYVAGLYRHPPTGEYRLLLRTRRSYREREPCYVFALGCSQPRPRCIGLPPEHAGFYDEPVLVCGNLHWSWWPYPAEKAITVFDTTAESFRMMRSPAVQTNKAYLYEEVDGTLGVYSWDAGGAEAVDIWVMQDYDTEVWSHKYHVQLPVGEIMYGSKNVMVVHDERDVFVLYIIGQTLLLVDTHGKLLASSSIDDHITRRPTRIKESLVQHNFFSALQGA